MAINSFASRTSYKAFASGDLTLTVASGDNVQVCGMILRAVTACIFTIKNTAGTTLFTVSVESNSSLELTTPWIADAGVAVTSAQEDATAVVFHNSPGN